MRSKTTWLIYHFPKSQNHEFKEKYSAIKWDNDKKLFEKIVLLVQMLTCEEVPVSEQIQK